VSLESSNICVVSATGRIIREAKVASEPSGLIALFGSLGFAIVRIGLEAGPLSQWLYAGMKDAGPAVELLETRPVRDAFKAIPVETNRKDARRNCAADADSVVQAGALQVASWAGGARLVGRTQTGAVEALRCRDKPSRHFARFRLEGLKHEAADF